MENEKAVHCAARYPASWAWGSGLNTVVVWSSRDPCVAILLYTMVVIARPNEVPS